jgi:T-complex protein 1 subunit beta
MLQDHFAELAVDAITRLKGSGNLEAIHIIKKAGGALKVRSWEAGGM